MSYRRITGAVSAVALALVVAGPAAAAGPSVETWSNQVDVPYFDCGTFEAHGVWTVSHVLKTFFDGDGTPVRDIEQMSFTGSFTNPTTGASIADAGKVIYFDTLAPDYSYLTTYGNTVRRSAYFKVAGRRDYQTGAFHGVDRFDVNIPAACAALGA